MFQTLYGLSPGFFLLIELQEAEKPIFWIVHIIYVIVPLAPWTDYPISLTRHGLTWAKIHSLAE